MNFGPLIFLAAFLAISASWFGLVLAPQVQLGRQMQSTNLVNKAEMYPQSRPGLAAEGLQVYRANGCAYCHSQQVQQSGTALNVILTKTGTNVEQVVTALLKADVGLTNVNAAGLSGGVPKAIISNASLTRAKLAVAAIKTGGGEASIELVPTGPDISWGWGVRRSVAQDYLYDDPVMLGASRFGPDLANVGTRLRDEQWHLRHLYAPQAEVKGSPMPAYRFLFETRKIQGKRSEDALNLPAEYVPAGYEVVPTHEALALVAYLQSLHAGVPLFEVPLSVAPPPSTAATTNSSAQSAAQ